MTTPMTTPIDPVITVPYVGVNEFRTAPTFLDSKNLVEGLPSANQDDELYNVLLRASAWASNDFCRLPLHAHTETENIRCRVDKYGRIKIHPKHKPIRQVTGIAFGADPTLMTLQTNLGGVWVEDQNGLVVSMLPASGLFLGALQFGSFPPGDDYLYVTIQYVAGYANTYLTSAATAGDNHLTVADPTGFQPGSTSIFNAPLGASVARIWDPAVEEAITVSSSYTAGANPVTLAGTVANNHAIGVQVSEMPPDIREAVICYTVALLMRQDVSSEAPRAGQVGPVARRAASGGKAGGLIEEAERMLTPYQRVR